MVPALGIALALAFAPAPAPAPAAQPLASEPEPLLCDVAIRSEALAYAEFEGAAALRLPGVRLREAIGEADPECVGRLHGYVELRPDPAGGWALSLITSDGHAWYRTVAHEPDQAARALASVLANLIAAIEDASGEPDAKLVTLPAELIEEPAIATPEPEAEEPEEPEEPEAVIEPTARAGELESAEPKPIRLEIGPRLSGAVVVGLAPGPGLRGAGGGLGLDLRLPDGLGVGLDLRALSTSAVGVSLTRLRIALGIGWIARNGMFELPVLISGVVEPWFVRADGSPTPLGQPPMIGGGARVAPGLLLPAGPVQLRIGLSLGFEIAVEAARGGVIPALTKEPGIDPFLRAGGVELSAGLELGLWIPVY